MSTHARPLAVWLAAAPDTQLAALFAARDVRPDAAWADFFDAAQALLEPASIERMLSQLTLDEARVLHRATDPSSPAAAVSEPARTSAGASLISLALLRPEGTPYPPVAEVVMARSAPAGAPPNTEAAPASEGASAHAAERAFTTISALADVLLMSRETPMTLLTSGHVAAGDKRRLEDAGLQPDIVDDLVALAGHARLAEASDRRLLVTSEGESWLRQSASERWGLVAEAFRAQLPRGLRTAGGGWPAVRQWASQHPWNPVWSAQVRELHRQAQLLGLIADGDSEPPWALALREGRAADIAALERMLPTEVDRIFLQNDLSAIAPGPLASALDVRLRAIATRESAAQASSYRFTAESVSHALATGETADSILDFLGELSLTGIPQPLEYLVTQTAQRHGLVRVFSDAGSGLTRVTSIDATLLDALAVDQALRPLGLTRDADGLVSRVGRDTVYWALTDARYPATIVGDDGQVRVIDRNPAPPPAGVDAATYDALIARLRARQGPDADAAWLDRELEAAVRSRSVLLVEVSMPDGTARELTLEASGLGGGRLRGRDRAADVERTLPVKSIRSARVVDPSVS